MHRLMGRIASRRLSTPRVPSRTRRSVGTVKLMDTPTSSSTMEVDQYSLASKNQYAAHLLTRGMLSASMARLARRCKLEDDGATSDGAPIRRRRLADLGSADGSSSMETLRYAVRCLKDETTSLSGHRMPLHVTFEEHPASSEEKLRTVLKAHDEWFARNDITWEVQMKSFYEPLFEPQSMDFIMSYICLHWLDTTDVAEDGDISQWKRLGVEDESDPNLDWAFINEATAPKRVREAWRTNLAHRHLAKCLALRSREMRPGAELLLVMVGHPHEFVVPADGGPAPLSRAIGACIERGEVTEEVFHRMVIPYYLRTAGDIPEALELARTLDVGPLISSEGEEERTGAFDEFGRKRTGAFLELVDCKSIPAITKGDKEDAVGGAFDLFWSIHLHSIECAHPTKDELQCIKMETRRVFDAIYDGELGIPSTFVACTLRKRSRERAGSR